ncbi:MAG: 3-oxoacyl-[acyl-carrier protein] reductase [Mycobacterium sp.]|nr:3-oxoacyl-[acyl-carrier protein] reductase [Mycobacterium sp.]
MHRADRDTVDLADAKQVEVLLDSIGPIDLLVNNAGGVSGQVGKPLEEVTEDEWHAVLDANLTTAFLCTKAAVSGMKDSGFGRIVIISSGAARGISLTSIQAYVSAKAAQVAFTRQLAHESGPYGITVNCIAPGFVLSSPTTQAQWDSYGEQGQRKVTEQIALRRLGSAEDIANGVRFLVSAQASWITGQLLAIDGGHTAL